MATRTIVHAFSRMERIGPGAVSCDAFGRPLDYDVMRIWPRCAWIGRQMEPGFYRFSQKERIERRRRQTQGFRSKFSAVFRRSIGRIWQIDRSPSGAIFIALLSPSDAVTFVSGNQCEIVALEMALLELDIHTIVRDAGRSEFVRYFKYVKHALDVASFGGCLMIEKIEE